MPEGDTIRRLADSLSQRFAGQSIKSSIFRHARLATVDLTGKTFLQADARGKHLLLRFSNAYTIHIHLRMTGSVYLRFAGEVRPERRKVEIQFENGWATAIDIPVLDMLRTQDESSVVGFLGPDICGAYDHAAAIQRFYATTSVPITQALLDQRLAAGFGNIYAVETPFIVGINPYTCVDRLSNFEGLLAVAVGLIRTNARYGPQNTTGKNLRWTNHWVLSRKTFQCKVCGTKIERVPGANSPWRRRHAWCTKCQPTDATEVNLARAAKLLAMHPCRQIVDLATGQFTTDVSEPVKTEFLRANEGGRKNMK